MRALLLSFIILFSTIAYSKAEPGANIVALVDNEPITLYEFKARKKMLMVLNNVQNPDSNTEQQINKSALNSLIDEQILLQYSNKVGNKVAEEDIEEAINTIEQRNKMPKGYMINFLKSNGVEVNSFRSQIKGELIKYSILSHLSRNITVSPKEIEATIFATNSKDAKVSIRVFTSINKEHKTLQNMYRLQQKIKTCDTLKEAMYKNFANINEVNDDLSKLDHQLQSIVKDLSSNKASSVFETPEGFKLVLLCEKKIKDITDEESGYIVNFLTNKKSSQKAQKLLGDIKKKAYIKVLLKI